MYLEYKIKLHETYILRLESRNYCQFLYFRQNPQQYIFIPGIFSEAEHNISSFHEYY